MSALPMDPDEGEPRVYSPECGKREVDDGCTHLACCCEHCLYREEALAARDELQRLRERLRMALEC